MSRKTGSIIWILLLISVMFGGIRSGRAQNTNSLSNAQIPQAKRVLMIFSDSRDLPGNVMLEQAARAEILTNNTNSVEFFTESMDAARFANPKHYRQFRNYIKNRYAGRNLDLMMLFMSRDFMLAREMPTALVTNLPLIYVVINDLEVPEPPRGRTFTGVFQRFDIQGTVKFIIRLQPETRRVVVIGGASPADQATLGRVAETAKSMDGVDFEFWTNRPMADIYEDAKKLSPGTVILFSTMQRDVTGQAYYTSQIIQRLAPSASVPVYVLGEGAIGSGAVGGSVIDLENLGNAVGDLATRVLAGTRVSEIPVEVRTNGVPMADWRALRRWEIAETRLPEGCDVRYRARSLWEGNWILIMSTATIFFAQAITIAALLVQRSQRRRAQAEIQRQRTELAHVARVSTMGQLASALTHELNQPLGAILRNAEAAEVFLQSDKPDLSEVRAILADIRRDDKRAGNVIDRMRSLYKRRNLTLGSLDLRELVEDTIALARTDAAQRRVKMTVEISSQLPAAQGDRVHLQQVLLNLLLNGMDAMKEIPKARRTLVVRAGETKNGNLRVTVSDCGTGVGPDDAVHIFEPFFTTKSNGMGMGLAISRTIIEAHGGDIWMESSAMEGTTFTFLLPPAGQEKLKTGDLPTPG